MTAHVTIHRNESPSAERRCDRCGAQSYFEAEVKVENRLKTLLFCAHHAEEHEEKLHEVAMFIVDYRPRLHSQEEKPDPAGDRR
jgi:cob(I)alamin adenosyltransferase